MSCMMSHGQHNVAVHINKKNTEEYCFLLVYAVPGALLEVAPFQDEQCKVRRRNSVSTSWYFSPLRLKIRV